MKLDDLERKVVRAAQLANGTATLAELGHALDADSRQVEECILVGDKAGVVEACGDVLLTVTLLLHKSRSSLIGALLDCMGNLEPEPARKPKARARRKDGAA